MPAIKVARLPSDPAGKVCIQQKMLAQLLTRIEAMAGDDIPERRKRSVQTLRPLFHHGPAAQIPLQLP